MEIKFVCDHDSLTDRYGRFVLKPLDRGAGAVVGNALRRVLLSQLDGAAVTAVKIPGVLHEFASIPGAVEDTSEVIRNLRGLDLKMSDSGPCTLRISAEGKGVVTARDLEADDGVTILNPSAHIVTLETGAKFTAEIEIDSGVGFRQAELGGREIGVIPVDADFCPVARVGYAVEKLEGDRELLSVELVTNGSIVPIDAVKKAASILKSGLTDERLISSKFDGTNGTFVIDAQFKQAGSMFYSGDHAIGHMLRWALMSYLSPDGKEPVTFADYTIQEVEHAASLFEDGGLMLEVHTDGTLGPKEAVSLAGKRLSEMLDVLLSQPVKERGLWDSGTAERRGDAATVSVSPRRRVSASPCLLWRRVLILARPGSLGCAARFL